MKRKLLSFIVLSVAACGISAQEEHPGGWDFNIPFIKTSKEPTIEGLIVVHNPDEYPGEYSKPRVCSFNIGWIAGTGQTDGVNIDMGQSYELELRNLICIKTQLDSRVWASFGMGLDWRNYRMTNHDRFIKQDDGTISVGTYPDGCNPKFSRIHTFSLNLPLQLHVALGHHCYMALGPELYFNTYASLKTRYRDSEGKKQKVTAKSLHRNTVTVGLECDITIRGIGVYYKYNPCHVLKTDFAPQFSSMTAGLRFCL